MSASTFRGNGTISASQQGKSDTTTGHANLAPHHTSWTTTVPREFVHRASIAEVMLTDWRRVDDNHFSLAAQWPRGHSFFANVDGCHDPLIAAETIRQAGILLAHAEFGVPLDHHLLMSDLSVAVRPEHVRVGWAPASLELDVTCTNVTWRRGGFTGCTIEVNILRDGFVAATGGGTVSCIGPKVYGRLRAAKLLDGGQPRVMPLTAPEAPQTVGRMSPMDVVLSPVGEAGRWQLRLDTRHPVLFDHPVDHVPGMVLLEAARQATAATLGHASLPLAITSEFVRYVEMDAPCAIEALRIPTSEPDREAVLVSVLQDGQLAFRATVAMTAGQG
ncbi:ScbA/BarX family gamma-butyrolactone biosynthesis protein [Streptomyces sp. CoH27]|uniref:ScbA/BarX family gamma-butyrolactone biosynthesis protein n=1 Tax=Streptomyces sp. CoH27 TaxID=2875763 RepID=UPI001CD2D69A|nr:ScbA/BarX family gamma-butyrolactone biosynthesis protein [Streptomyces sp. CoH27]